MDTDSDTEFCLLTRDAHTPDDSDPDDSLFANNEDGILFSVMCTGDETFAAHTEERYLFDSVRSASSASGQEQVVEFHATTERRIASMLDELRRRTTSMPAMREAEETIRANSPVEWNPYRPPRGQQYRERLEAMQVLEWEAFAEREMVVVGTSLLCCERPAESEEVCGEPASSAEFVSSSHPARLPPVDQSELETDYLTWKQFPGSALEMQLEVAGRRIPLPPREDLHPGRFVLLCHDGAVLEEMIECHDSGDEGYVDEEIICIGSDASPVNESRRVACGLPPLSPRAAQEQEAADYSAISWFEKDGIAQLINAGHRLPPPYDRTEENVQRLRAAQVPASQSVLLCTPPTVSIVQSESDRALRNARLSRALQYQRKCDTSTSPDKRSAQRSSSGNSPSVVSKQRQRQSRAMQRGSAGGRSVPASSSPPLVIRSSSHDVMHDGGLRRGVGDRVAQSSGGGDVSLLVIDGDARRWDVNASRRSSAKTSSHNANSSAQPRRSGGRQMRYTTDSGDESTANEDVDQLHVTGHHYGAVVNVHQSSGRIGDTEGSVSNSLCKLPEIPSHSRRPPTTASMKSLQRAQTAYVRPSVKKSVV